MNAQSNVAVSADGVPIHYDVRGNGATALVFVHGWCCNRHYWDRQAGHFALHYTVVGLDLAGHGASRRDRARWTMPAFGQDVVAVVEQLGLEQVVLIGHSMGGTVIVEAARRLPTAVIGLVGVDTWHNVEHALTPAQVAEFVAPFRTDFVKAARTFVGTMFVPTSDATLAEDIVAAISAAPPHIGIGAGEQALAYDRILREGLQEVKAPKIAINSADRGATNMEAAQRCGIEAEGLLMYLDKADVRRLVHRLHETFPGCRLVADVFSRLTARSATSHPSLKHTGATIGWGAASVQRRSHWCIIEPAERTLS